MKKLQYKKDIKAPKGVVYEKMLGRATYKQWTSAFSATSDFEGGWNKGDKIRFIGISENGKKEGMLAQIAENIPNEYVSIRHYGLVDGDNEITEGPEVEAWTPSFENYTFSENAGVTTVTVEVDTNEEYFEYFNEAWPKALDKLREISEQ